MNAIKRKVLSKALIIFSTTWVASTLADLEFYGEACIIDEAAQLSEPDAVIALREQKMLKLVVFASDEMQLSPVLKSDQSETNSLGEMLTTSMMTRLLIGYPNITKISLVQNYRSHPSLVRMPSYAFYADDLIAARSIDEWSTDTKLHASIRQVFLDKIPYGKEHLERDNRQLFFNVNSLPECEPGDTSYCNRGGIAAIVKFIGMLLEAGVDASEISVISAY